MGKKARVKEVCSACEKTKHTVSMHRLSGRRMCAECRARLTTPRPSLASVVAENEQLRSAMHLQLEQLSALHQLAFQRHVSMQLLQQTLGKTQHNLMLQCAVTRSMMDEKAALAKALEAATVSNDEQKATITSALKTVQAIELVRDQLQDEMQDMRRENARLLDGRLETANSSAAIARALKAANEELETHNRELSSQLASKSPASPPAMTTEQHESLQSV